MASDNGAKPSTSATEEKIPPKSAESAAQTAQADEASRLLTLIDRLEKRTSDLARELQGPALEEAKKKVREHLFVSLLAAIGLGFLFGLIFGGFGRGRR